MEEKKDIPVAKQQPSAALTKRDKTQGWITLERERSFGSVTGSEFRVWGEK